MGDQSCPYASAHSVSPPQQAIDNMRSSNESPRYENVDSDIGKESSSSVEYCNVQCSNPDQITVERTPTLPSEVTQDIPDVVPRDSDCRESRKITGVEQVIINDDIYYCPLDDTRPSPGCSDDEDI